MSFNNSVNDKTSFNTGIFTHPFISPSRICEIFRDGRAFSKIAEDIVSFKYGLKTVIGDKDHDLTDSDGNKYEVKTLTENGLKTCPSSMLGKGRLYDKDKHLDYLNSKCGFFIVDNTQYPIVTIYYIKDVNVLHFANKSLKSSIALLDGLVFNNGVM